MCCTTGPRHGGCHPGQHHGGRLSHCEHSRFEPCILTKEEAITRLEKYTDGLQEEMQAVQQRIADLRGTD